MHNNLLVLQSDFGLVDGAVSAMIGVALEESPTLKIHHLTHDITPTISLRELPSLSDSRLLARRDDLCFGGRSGGRFQTKECSS